MWRNLLGKFLFLMYVVSFLGCSKDSQDNLGVPEKSVNVLTITAQYKQTPDLESIPGTVNAVENIQIASKVMGTILSIEVQEGDAVRIGQSLVSIDSRDLQPGVNKAAAALDEMDAALTELLKIERELDASIDAAQANYDYASTNFQRYKSLFDKDAISKEMFDEVRRQYSLAVANLSVVKARKSGLIDKKNQLISKQHQVQADMQLAKTYLGNTQIVSPVAGRVIRRLHDPGSMAVPGQPILLIQSGGFEFIGSIKESLSENIRVGDSVKIDFNNSKESIAAKVSQVVPGVDAMSRTVRIKVRLPRGIKIQSGAYGKLLIPLGSSQKLMLPIDSVVKRNSIEGVFVVSDENVVRYRPVKTSNNVDNQVVIVSGVHVGDNVIYPVPHGLKEGMKVKVARE